MFLKHIRLRNFCSFQDAEISFENEDESQRKWTVIVGGNGVGKSNLLRAIALVTAGTKALPALLGQDPSAWIQYRKKTCRINMMLETTDEEVRELELRIDRHDTPEQVVEKNKDSLKDIDRAIRHTARNYFVVGYGASRRLAPAFNSPVPRGNTPFRIQRVDSLFNPEATLNPLDTWATKLHRKSRKDLATILEILNDFFHGTGQDISIHGVDDDKNLIFKTPYGKIPLRHLGHGHRDMAAWVGDLLYQVTCAFGDYSDPLNARGVLLIDEFALHLHPQWQRRLHQFLTDKLPRFQLVVTTYSPMIAQQAGPGEVHLANYVGNHDAEVHAFEGDPRKMLLHQIAMSDLFGIDSDESADSTKIKDEYRDLVRKKNKSASERKRVKELKEQIEDLPQIERPNMKLSTEMKRLSAMYDQMRAMTE